MIRLEFLKVKNHPQLGDLDINLLDINELGQNDEPYTSLIIGPNGTGKSFILRTIAEIFRELKGSQQSGKSSTNISFDFDLQYYIDINQYRIIQNKIPNKQSKKLQILKNGDSVKNLNKDGDFLVELQKSYITIDELELPTKVIVNSVMLTDRFVWQNSNPSDFYQYLGVRSTKTTSSTQSSARRTIKHLFSASKENTNFIPALKELLNFLGFEEGFKVQYSTKINKLFFSGELTVANFRKYYEYWWDESFTYSKRDEKNPLWSVPYYKNNFKDNAEATQTIVDYLNSISRGENRLEHKPNSSSKIISIDLFDKTKSEEELGLIVHLENLDILSLDGIKIKKYNSPLSISEISSGEYHLLITLIGMFSSIDQNCLILIDEPEISLHPNWQMKYVSFLKQMFSKFGSCQFIITTHSHFLISDLDGKSSSVLALKRLKETNLLTTDLLEGNTFGWSAEEVLYTVFEVRSTRNSFLEYDLTKLVTMVNRDSKEFEEIRRILNKIDHLVLSEGDPLRVIKEKAETYLIKNNA